LDARHAGHPLIRQDHVDRPRGVEDFDRVASAGAGDHPVIEAEQVVHRAKHFGLVIDYQERRMRETHDETPRFDPPGPDQPDRSTGPSGRKRLISVTSLPTSLYRSS